MRQQRRHQLPARPDGRRPERARRHLGNPQKSFCNSVGTCGCLDPADCITANGGGDGTCACGMYLDSCDSQLDCCTGYTKCAPSNLAPDKNKVCQPNN